MCERFKQFWDKFGYACVLTICIGMIAATAIWTRRPQPEAEAPEVTRYALTTPTPQPASMEMTLEPAETQTVFSIPCQGEVGMPYAQEELVYSKTLGEYTTHDGVDFLGEEGDAVRAIGDGKVTDVWEDALLGHCIEITHRSGYISTYASLATEGLVAVDETVSRGQVIGTMGTSAVLECAEGPHLHLELRRLRKLENPIVFIQEDVS